MATPRFPQGPFIDTQSGYLSLEAQQWLQNPEFLTVTIDAPLPVASGGTGQTTALPDTLSMAGPFYPSLPNGPDTGTTQTTVVVWGGVGVPDNACGMNGNFYYRGDGIAANTNIYKKAGGIWSGIA